MHIELFGCTGAGKSRLLEQILATHTNQRPTIIRSDDLLLQHVHLQWVAGTARLVVLNVLSISLCMTAWRKHREFLRFVISCICQLRTSVSLLERLRILRITLRNVGLHEMAERHAVAGDVVFTDEGMLQIAHYLFVNVTRKANTDQILSFAALVPVPTVAVYISQPDALLIQRTAARGHKRIPAGSRAMVERFIARATDMFQLLTLQPRIKNRLLTINGQQQVLLAAHGTTDSELEEAASLIRPVLSATARSTGVESCSQ